MKEGKDIGSRFDKKGSGIRSKRLCKVFFFQAEDGIRDLVRSRGLGDVYKRQAQDADSLRAVEVGYFWIDEAPLCSQEAFRVAMGLSLIHI